MPELVPPGWVKMQYQNPAETFLSAYFQATQVNSKRQQMENAMAKLGLENERINLQRDLGEQRLGFQMNSAERRAQIAEGTLQIRQADEQFKQDKFNSQVDDLSALHQDLGNLESKPGDPNYPSDLNNVFAKHSSAEMSPSGRQVLRFQQNKHNSSVDTNRRAIKSDEDLLNRDLKNDNIPMDALNNPEQWQDQYVDKSGKLVDPNTPGATYTKKKFIPRGVKEIPDVKTPGGKKTVADFATIPESKLKQYQSRYQDLQKRKMTLPDQITDTSTGVVPTRSASPDKVKMKHPNGTIGMVPSSQVDEAVSQGYTVIGQ